MSDDIFIGLEGEFEFEITFPRLLTDHDYFYGEWAGPVSTVGAPTFAAHTEHTKHLGHGRYRIIGHVVDWTKPGLYVNRTSEVRGLHGHTVEQVRPPFRSLLVQGYGADSEEDYKE
jgi:hypothetical protein